MKFWLLLFLLLVSCGPIKKIEANHFYVIVYNDDDPAFTDNIRVSWWNGSLIVGDIDFGQVRGGDSVSVNMGDTCPDGVEIDVTGSFNVFQTPEYDDCWVFEVRPYKRWSINKKYLKSQVK